MAKVQFKRIENSSNINNIPILDGQVIYTGNGKQYMDYGTNRIQFGNSGGGSGGTEGTLLWENPHINDTWQESYYYQTTADLELDDDISEYDAFEIIYSVGWNTDANSNCKIHTTGIIPILHKSNLGAIGTSITSTIADVDNSALYGTKVLTYFVNVSTPYENEQWNYSVMEWHEVQSFEHGFVPASGTTWGGGVYELHRGQVDNYHYLQPIRIIGYKYS